LLVNSAANANHWLGVQLRGTVSNRSAIGARVVAEGTKRQWVDEVRSGSSYSSSSDLRLHFGLGKENTIKGLVVRWPNGARESFSVGDINRFIEIVEGKGTPVK